MTLTNDALGQVVRRDEADTNYSLGDPHGRWYRFNGKQIGFTGNNGSDDMSYSASIAERDAAAPTGTPGPFRDGVSYSMAYANFDQSYAPINTYGQGSSGGMYTVRWRITVRNSIVNGPPPFVSDGWRRRRVDIE